VKLSDDTVEVRFDPMSDMPTNDNEVRLCLSYAKDRLTASNLFGIYQCRRGIGEDLLTAYEYALRVHISIPTRGLL